MFVFQSGVKTERHHALVCNRRRVIQDTHARFHRDREQREVRRYRRLDHRIRRTAPGSESSPTARYLRRRKHARAAAAHQRITSALSGAASQLHASIINHLFMIETLYTLILQRGRVIFCECARLPVHDPLSENNWKNKSPVKLFVLQTSDYDYHNTVK